MCGTSCLDHMCPLSAYSCALCHTWPVPKQVELNLKHAQIQSQANPLPKSADPTERPRSLGQKRYFHLSETVSHWTCMLILAWTSIPSGYGYWKASRVDNGLCWEDWKRNFSFCFHFWGDWGVQVHMFKKWEKESAKHQERKLAAGKWTLQYLSHRERKGTAFITNTTRYKQRSEALPTIYNLGLKFSNVVGSNSTFGLLGFGSTLINSKCGSSEHSKNILQATARICCDLDGYTLGMIGMASTGHLGWKPMPANPTPISSDTAFTCKNWPKSIAIST